MLKTEQLDADKAIRIVETLIKHKYTVRKTINENGVTVQVLEFYDDMVAVGYKGVTGTVNADSNSPVWVLVALMP